MFKTRYPINYFGRVRDNCDEERRFNNNKRLSNIFELIMDGSGVLDLYTDDALPLLEMTSRKGYDTYYKSANKRVLWITEVYPLRKTLYDLLDSKKDKVMENYNIDYIFSMDKEFCNQDDRLIHLKGNGSLIRKPDMYKKNKICSMVASSKSFLPMHRERLKYVEKFKKQVDLYGIGFNEIKTKEQGLANYMFTIAIENCRRELTFTEKLLDCFLTGTIPVYLGATHIEQVFDPRGIITLNEEFNPNDLTPELYDSMLPFAYKNLLIAESILVPVENALLQITDLPASPNNITSRDILANEYIKV